jgi:hypothetical protein
MCWIVWLVLGVLVVLSGCSGSPDTAVDSTTGSTAVSSSSTIRESTTTTTATASTTTTAPATTTTTTLIATTTTLLSPTSATTRTTTATADPADPDKLSAESFSELIGLEWKPVRDPEAVLDSWIWRVLDVSVEPPHLRPFWSLGGWVVDFDEAEQHWGVAVFTANDPGLDSPTLGPHFIVLNQAIGHDESGRAVWRIHDVRVVPEIATNGWIQQCYERSAIPDWNVWSVAAYVAGEPVDGEYGLEIAARDAWRIDIDAGHFESIDTESIICVHEVE